jgi:hypothetical protein
MPYDSTKHPEAYVPTAQSTNGRKVTVVVPSDTVDFTSYPSKLYIGVAGDVKCIPVGNDDASPVTFKSVPVGFLEIQVRRVFATGTAATNILAIYK